MKKAVLFSILLMACPGLLGAMELSANWKVGDRFVYAIEIRDERPPVKGKAWVTVSRFKASLTVLGKADHSCQVEWKYLPVEQPVVQCPLADASSCYTYQHAIKQALRLELITSEEGGYEGLANPDDVMQQIGELFDRFAGSERAGSLKKLDADALDQFRETVVYDDTIVAELLDYHAVYGNALQGGQFAPGSRIDQFAQQAMAIHTSRVFDRDGVLTIETNLASPLKENTQEHLQQRHFRYRWKFDRTNLAILEFKKRVVLQTGEGKRAFQLQFTLIP